MTDTIISSIIHTEEYRIISKQDTLVMLDTLDKRGMILDIENKLIITPGFNIYEDNKIETDNDINSIPDGEYYLGREGIEVYIYQYNNKIHVSTISSINCEDNILRAKIANVGLDITTLFPIECNGVSDVSYHYIISHRDDIIASKINLYHKEGFAYYISKHYIRSTGIGIEHDNTLEIFEEVNVPIDVAKDFLIRGYHPDIIPNDVREFQLGEFINVRTREGKYVRVLSTSYVWRKKIRDNEYKIRYGFYKHLTLAMKAKKQSNSKNPDSPRLDYDEYMKLFPIVQYIEPRCIETYIKTHGYITNWPKIGRLTNINYIYNTWACYMLALPLHLHQEACNLYNDYFNVCNRCYNYIVGLWKSGAELIPNVQYSDSVDTIAVKRIDDIIKQSNKNIGDGKIGSFEKNCQNLIKKERGSSLFAMNEYITKRTN